MQSMCVNYKSNDDNGDDDDGGGDGDGDDGDGDDDNDDHLVTPVRSTKVKKSLKWKTNHSVHRGWKITYKYLYLY